MKKLIRFLIIIAILAIIGMLIFVGIKKGWFSKFAGLFHKPEQTVEQVADDSTLTEEDKAQIQTNLTVNLDQATLQSLFSDVSWVALQDSYPVVYGDDIANNDTMQTRRTTAAGFDDAVSFPFESEDKVEALAEEYEQILRDPIDGIMVARALKDLEIYDGQTLGDWNPWLVSLVDYADDAFAEEAHPYGNEKFVVYQTLTDNSDYVRDENGQPVVYVTTYYRYQAIKLCVLLDRFTNKGFLDGYESTKNWCLNLSAEAARTMAIEADYQENKTALVLVYTKKNGGEVIIGFNKFDKRIEILKKTPTPTPTTTTTPDPTPTITTTPDPTPTPTPDPKKDPSQDPVNNGNADTGGGQNQPDDGAGPFQPTDPVTNPDQGHEDPADVTPTNPPQDNDHTDPADNTDSNPISYDPDNPGQSTGWTDNNDPSHSVTYPTGSGDTNTDPPAGSMAEPD